MLDVLIQRNGCNNIMRNLRFQTGRPIQLNAMRTGKKYLLFTALFGFLLVAPSLFAEEKKEDIKDGYTINYNTVSIIEYIKFASKICNINFIFDEADLNFTVTVVSEGPITAKSVMSTLVQILRIHGLMLLEQDNNLVIHKSTDVKQMATLVSGPGQSGNAPIVTRIFRIKNANPESVAAIVRTMISNSAMLEESPETRQIILTDVTANVDKIANLIENLDSPQTLLDIKTYEALNNSTHYLIELGSQIMQPIAQGNPFILVPADLANLIYVVSTPELSNQAVGVFQALDLPPKKNILASRKIKSENIFVYKLLYRNGEEVIHGLENIADALEKAGVPDADLLDAIDNAKYIPSTQSIMFVGSEDSIDKIKEFLVALDAAGTDADSDRSSFFVYKPVNRSAKEIDAALKEMAQNLNGAKGSDPALIETIKQSKINGVTNTITFSGEDRTFARVKELLATIDTPNGKSRAFGKNSFYVYKIQAAPAADIEKSLKDFAKNLDKSDASEEGLIETIGSMKYIKETNSFLFTGPEGSLKRIQELVPTFDSGIDESIKNRGYYIYKLQNTTGDVIEDDLDNLAKNFKSSGLKDSRILTVIDSIRYIKETNSLLLTGDPKAIEEVKELIAKYDYARNTRTVSSNFFMYKPQHVTASVVEKSLREISNNLKKADLADPALLSTIESVKYVDTTNSLIFTGTPDAITKLQSLIKDIDVPPSKHAAIQHVGKTTFLLYKLKNANGSQITTSLKAIAGDLKKSGTSDKDFLAALNTMKYVKETNSLMFTGTEESLTKVQTLVEKFDVTSLGQATGVVPSATGPTNFFVYKPQSVSGPELEKLMVDFTDNLKMTGLSDPDLFNTVGTMRWVEKTQSLIFTGTQKSLDQVKALLKDFDIPSNLPGGAIPGGPLEPSIQAIDNTSFLVYKLQFHKGDEIQGALRQIAKDLILSNAPVNQNLLNSINSIQWLEVTNSLLCSGDQETLTRLRELIKNLDIPLKQVFIEMLVIQTSLTNALTFGLEWGGNYKYRNKFAGTLNNTVPGSNLPTSSTDPLLSSLSTVTPTSSSALATPPFPGGISQGLGSGFDLGVVGQVIKHHGQTYLNLSSLMSALQTDSEATIVMTPKLITQDGRTSSIFSGQNIPFAGSFVSQAGTNSIGTTNMEYRDIGVNLTITPVLGNSDIVTLDIALDQSSVDSSQQTGQISFNEQGFPSAINGITSSKTSMQTTVHVPDNHFLILSGMVNNSTSKTKTGIPCLGGLPIVGAAFSQDNDTISNSNIVIFLRPHILNSLDDMTRITSEQEEFFRDQTSTPNLEHSYNEAMELIKTVDDE